MSPLLVDVGTPHVREWDACKILILIACICQYCCVFVSMSMYFMCLSRGLRSALQAPDMEYTYM